MVSPAVRRQQVKSGRQTGLSQRRACQLLRVARSTLNYPSRQELKDQRLWEQIRPLAQRYPRYGYRRIWALLRRAGEPINHKRVHRLWKLQALSLSRKRKRPRRGPPSPRPLAPTRPNEVWAYDFVHDRCANGQPLKCLGLVDEYTRECLALEVESRIDAQRVMESLERTMRRYGAPQYLRSDHGERVCGSSGEELAERAGGEDRVHRTGETVAKRGERELLRQIAG